jgi:predicted metal-dependent phosphoesterase TrpH
VNTYQGALHLHSTHSDGEFTLAELRDVYLRAGCVFACVTDHAEAFDAAKRDAYERECQALSDESFQFIAGLEYECQNRLHILGYGITALANTTDPEAIIATIEIQGGIAVIAHPKDAHFPWIEGFRRLPSGIETWNSKYDGRWAPRPQTFALLARLQARHQALRAYYGQDLHWRKQYRSLFTQVRCAAPQPEQILAALRRGDYVGIKDELILPSTGKLPKRLLARFGRVHRWAHSFRQVLKSAKKVLDRSGAAVPLCVKSQLRRLF